MNAAILSRNRGVSPSVDIANAFKARVLADGGMYEGHESLISTIKMMRHKSIYDHASIILTPNGYKSGKIYALKSTQGATDFSYSGGGGSRMNADGNMVNVPLNVPKIDYANGYPEILLERASTNVLLHSETLSSQVINVNTQSYVLSFYGSGTVTINETTPIVLTGTSINTRVYTTFLLSAGSKSITVSGEVKYAQMEPMNNPTYYNFPTSWIPTTGTSVSRNISSLLKNGLSSLINQQEGTIVFSFIRKGAGNLIRIDDGSSNNEIRLYNTYDSQDRIQVNFSKGDTILTTTVLINPPSMLRIALKYNLTSITIYLNGDFFYSISNYNTLSSPFSRISLSPTISLVNRTQYLAYIPEYLSNSELSKYSL